jgi:hypothetical protein
MLDLADVLCVISYYLNHRDEVEQYLERNSHKAERCAPRWDHVSRRLASKNVCLPVAQATPTKEPNHCCFLADDDFNRLDVATVSAGIHMEMNRAENQIDNNIIWDIRNAEPGTLGQRSAAGSGVFLHASEKQIIAQNLIGGCDNVGVFPVLREDRDGSGRGVPKHVRTVRSSCPANAY